MRSMSSTIRAGSPAARLRRACLPAMVLAAMATGVQAVPLAAAAAPDDVSFDADFFPSGTAPKVDLSRFAHGDVALAGSYRGDVVVNQVWQQRTDIVLRDVDGNDSAQPCYTATFLRELGVDLDKLVSDPANLPEIPMPVGSFCDAIGRYIPGATASFDMGEQSLSLSIPQVYTARNARGYVDPSQWDEGINALTLGYNGNVYRNDSRDGSATTAYLGMNSSLSLGAWHVRHLGAFSWSSNRGGQYKANASYLQHDIPALKAQFIAGDTYTPGDFFDSVRMRGIRMFTDDRMLPQSMRGFAPVVRGVADTNARVVVRQRGYVVSDSSVAPGPFVIDDLYPTGYGGDLDVEVIEADGRVNRFVVPFSAVPQLLRPGQQRWDLSSGRVQQDNLHAQPFFLQGTLQRGLSNHLTGYVGSTVANGYAAALVGTAVNTSVGAFSLDATHSRNAPPRQSATQGTSLRLGYSKNFVNTGTDFALAAYRYSTEGYVSFNDAVAMRDLAARGLDGSILARERSRLSANINQRLGDRGGQIYLSGAVRDYWGDSQRQVDFSAGYSNNYRSFSYSFSAQRSLATGRSSLVDRNRIPGATEYATPALDGRRETRFMLTFSVPLGASSGAPQLVGMADRSDAGSTARATVSGLAGADNRYNYSGTLGHANGSASLDASGGYTGGSANLGASFSDGNGYRQASGSASGSLLVHGGGWTFTPPLGETVGLVQASNAAGARVENGQGSVVDRNGFAVVPNLQPYQLNVVTLDPKGASNDVELTSTTQRVAPRAGTVVRLKYETTHGRAVIIDTRLSDGRPVPFGADVFDAAGNSVGVAGQASRLMLRDMPLSGEVSVKWGDGVDDRCTVRIALSTNGGDRASSMERYDAVCSPAGSASAHAAAAQRYPGVYGSPWLPGNMFIAMRAEG